MDAPSDVQAVQAALRQAWSPRSSSQWTANAPAVGQCSPTALVIHECFGGTILKTPIGSAWHFYNRIAGHRFDFTAEQFEIAPAYEDHLATRDEALLNCTEEQHVALSRDFMAVAQLVKS